MPYLHELECCGIRELADVQDANSLDDILSQIKSRLARYTGGKPAYAFECGALVFTEAGRGSTYGRKLAKEIKSNKLGTITTAPVYTNPNSERTIRAFIWAFNKKALSAYLEKLDKPKKKPKPFKWN